MVKASASMLKARNTCPMKVYYRRKRTPTVKSASMIVGSLIHDLVSEYESKGEVDLQVYHAKMTKQLSSGEITFTRWQTGNALWKLMNTCYNNYLVLREELPPIIDIEARFNVKYSDDVEVVGRFDQIRDENILVELKTSHYPPTEEFLAADIQATLYIWTYKELFHVTPRYYYIHLPVGSIYEVYRNNFDDLHDNIHDYIITCEQEYYPKAKDGYKCSKCEYRAVCLTENEGCKLIKQVTTRSKKKDKPKDSFF